MAINPIQSPINYMAMIKRPDIGRGFADLGKELFELGEQQKAEEIKRQYAVDLQNAFDNPTQLTWAQMVAKYPNQHQAFEVVAKMYEKDTLDAEFLQGAQISTALENGNVDVAQAQLQTIVDGHVNSGKNPGIYKQVLEQIKSGDIKGAQAATNMALVLLDPDKFTKISAAGADKEFRAVMQGVETVEDVFARIPQLAQLGKPGVEHAERLLTQQRLREQQKDSRAQEKVETLKAMQTLNALFIPPDEKSQSQSFVVNKAGDIEPNESVWSKYAFIPTAGGPGMAVPGAVPSAAPAAPIFDRAKAAALGLDEATIGLIQAQIQLNPKEGAKLLGDIVQQNIRNKIKAQQPATLSPYAKMLVEAGFDLGTPEFIERMRKHTEASTKGAATGGAVSVTVGEAQKTIGKDFGKFAMEAVDAAQKANEVALDVSMIVEGMRGMGGGPIAQFKAWAGQFLPAGSDWGRINSMSELANTIQAKLAPQMRAAGSGSTSDMEMKSFMRAIPTLQTSERGRELMAKYSRRIADRAQVRAEIVNDIEGKGRLPTPAEISAKMKARIGDVFFDAADREYFGIKRTAPGAKPETVTVGGKTYSRPPSFTDAQWAAYKESMGAK